MGLNSTGQQYTAAVRAKDTKQSTSRRQQRPKIQNSSCCLWHPLVLALPPHLMAILGMQDEAAWVNWLLRLTVRRNQTNMDCKTCGSLVATWVCLATSLPDARCLRQQTRGARDGGLGPDGLLPGVRQAPVRYERGLMIGLGIGMWARLHASTRSSPAGFSSLVPHAHF